MKICYPKEGQVRHDTHANRYRLLAVKKNFINVKKEKEESKSFYNVLKIKINLLVRKIHVKITKKL